MDLYHMNDMMRVSQHTARKTHPCVNCRGNIQPGEKYYRFVELPHTVTWTAWDEVDGEDIPFGVFKTHVFACVEPL